jgi:hypothetical protein
MFNIFFSIRSNMVVHGNYYYTISNAESFPCRLLRHTLLILVAYYEDKVQYQINYPLSFSFIN